jgi:hypothetical protein
MTVRSLHENLPSLIRWAFFLKRNPARRPGVNHLAMACQGGKAGGISKPGLNSSENR